MPLHELLPPSHILVPLQATTLRDAIVRIVTHLASEGAIDDPEPLLALVRGGRLRDIAAIGEKVALPHARTNAVSRLVVALAVAGQPLDGDEFGLATRPRILAFVLAPPAATTNYLQTVGLLAQFFHQENVVEQLVQARSSEDVLAIPELRGLSVNPRLTVRDVMTHGPRTIGPGDSARDALDLLIDGRFHAAPVVGDKGEVLGIVTDRDLLRALLRETPEGESAPALRGSPRQIKIRDVMSRSVLCVSADLELDDVANTMINKDIQLVPVVSEGRLIGVLTRGDIIRKLYGR